MVSSVSGVNKKNEIKAASIGAAIGMAAPVYTFYDSVRRMTPERAASAAEDMKLLMPEADTFKRTKEVATKILEETGLKAKGVKLNFIDDSSESLNNLKNIIKKEASDSNFLGKRMGANHFETFKAGANAAFFSKSNDVVVNSKNLYSSVYHELGHAMNKNGNIFTKGLQKARGITPFGISVLAPIFLAVGLLHKVDKNKPKEEKGKIEKTLDFISENAGKLTLASYVPLLAEEGLASIRGLKHAAKHLPKDVLGKLSLNYLKAWGTYAAVAAIVAGGVAMGIQTANNIRKKKNSVQ